MIAIDTSVWVDVLRDRTLRRRRQVERFVGDHEVVLSRFTQLELLQGCRDARQWQRLATYLETQDYLEVSPSAWAEAARIFFQLRRTGRTVRSPIDCCIAQVAIENDVLLLHRDRDFETIARVTTLRERFLAWDEEPPGHTPSPGAP